jgi:SH3-like domain-containing protein
MQAHARPLSLLSFPVLARASVCAVFLALLAVVCAAPAAMSEERMVGLSGKPLPRFETLRFNTVNGFAGPSKDHQLRGQYTRKGLPVVVVAETETWRQIVDPDGEKVWVPRGQLLSHAGTAVVRGEASVPLYARAQGKGRVRALVDPGVIVLVRGCEGNWCAVRIDKRKGFIAQDTLWGLGKPPVEPSPVPIGLAIRADETGAHPSS